MYMEDLAAEFGLKTQVSEWLPESHHALDYITDGYAEFFIAGCYLTCPELAGVRRA